VSEGSAADNPMQWNAARYETGCTFVWKSVADLVDLLDPQPGERILDLGCGTGHLTNAIAERGAEAIGLDVSTDMLGQARQNYPRLHFMLGDATDFRFDRPFDAVFSNAALHWVGDAEAVVRAVTSALKPGGRFVAEFGGKGNIVQLLAGIRQVVPEALNPWYFPSIGEYAALLERNGLEPRYASLFERPTKLEGSIQEWFEMFGEPLLATVPRHRRRDVLDRVATVLRPDLHRDGHWWADYRRIRVMAVK
jgi:trans-aconitate methyltransferase